MENIKIPVRELHARTGHYVRKAANRHRIIITDRGKPIAELQPLDKRGGNFKRGQWKDRLLLPEFAAVMDQSVGGTESAEIISEERERGSDW